MDWRKREGRIGWRVSAHRLHCLNQFTKEIESTRAELHIIRLMSALFLPELWTHSSHLMKILLSFFAAITLLPIYCQEIIDPDIGDPYPLVNCVLSSEPLDEEFETIDYQGREIRVCCADCASRFSDEGDIHINDINTQLIEQQRPYYPLDKCIVTGKALGKEAIEHIFRNRLFRLSSLEAVAKLEKAPSQ